MANRRTYPVYLHDDGFVGVAPVTFSIWRGRGTARVDGPSAPRRRGAGHRRRFRHLASRRGRGAVRPRPHPATSPEVGIEPATRPRITVIQALPKTDRADSAVELLTEVGVDRIAAWQASRCVAPVGRRSSGCEGWRAGERTAREAAKQSRRTWTPDLVGPWRTVEAVAAVAAADLAFVLHETARSRWWPNFPSGDPAEVVIVVGPEGGLTSDEVAALAAAGARVVGWARR